MLKFLLALLVVALTAALWLLAETLSLPSWAPAWATVGALALIALLVTVEILQRRGRRLREAKRAAERSTLHQVVLGLKSRCEHAVDLLRQQSADQLPWFLLAGPGGAGKTAALRSSGLSFRDGLGPERFIAGGDVAPTENIQFIASDRAVFLDTAGRYLCDSPDHDDRREWLELLGLLRAQRPGRPLAGVVLTVAAPELAAATPENAASLGHVLRRRLDDIQREFGAAFPVYLLVTKLDALAGLARLLSDSTPRTAGREDPGDRFGFVLELSGAGASTARRVAEGPLAELTLALERRAFARLGQAAVAEERGELYRSPGLFGQLADRTTALLATIFPDHGESDAPIWRGLFFASAGTLTPTPPVDPELQQIAREYNSPPQQGELAPAPLPRPLFLHHLFAEQVVADAWIAAPTRRQRTRTSTRHVVRTATLVAVASAILVLTLESARANHRLIGEISAAATQVERDVPDPARPILPREIAPLQAVARKLDVHDGEGPPWGLRWGLYQGDALVAPVTHTFRIKARERLVGPLVERARDHLTRLYNQHKDSIDAVPVTQYWSAVDALHLYLLLTRPQPNNNLRLSDEAQQRWLIEAMAGAWIAALGLPPHELLEALDFCRAYIPAVDPNVDLPAADGVLIERARQILARTDRGKMWVDDLQALDIPNTRPILLSSIAAGSGWLASNKGHKVHAAFTRVGWDTVRGELRCGSGNKYLTAAEVVDQISCEEERRSLHGRYFGEYTTQWVRFIEDISVREPSGPTERERYQNIETQISAMSTPGGPGANALKNLFRVIGENAQLEQPEDTGAGAAAASLVQWTVAEHRRRLILAGGRDPYTPDGTSAVSTVAQVRDALHGYYSYGHIPAGDPSGAPLDAYINRLARITPPLGQYNKERDQTKLADAQQRAQEVYDLIHNEHLLQRDPRWKASLINILEPPIRGLLDAIARGQLDNLTDRWCNDVVYPFDNMAKCYPFSKAGTCDASGDEVTIIFQPQNGALWRFYNEELQARFPYSGDKYVTAPQGYNSTVKLNAEVARFLTHAREFGDVVFPFGAASPGFSFQVQFRSLTGASDIVLTVDGTAIAFNNSDRDGFQPMKWPGEGGSPGANLRATTRGGAAKIERPGYWALFKLIEEADIQRSDRMISLHYDFYKSEAKQPATATLRINPSDGNGNPIFGRPRPDAPPRTPMDVFRPPRLVPPRNLFVGGKSCKSTPTR